MDARARAVAELAKHHLVMCSRTGLLICTKPGAPVRCSKGMKLERKAVRAHIMYKDGMDKGTYRHCFELATSLFPAVVDTELQKKYLEGGAQHGVLPCLVGVRILNGKKCFVCDKIFVNDETLRTHLGREHSGHGKSVTDITNRCSQACQTLKTSGGYFFVTGKTGCIDDNVEMDEYDPGAVTIGAKRDIQDSHVSPFVSSANVQHKLRASGLNLEMAGRIMDIYSDLYDEELSIKMKTVNESIGAMLVEAKRAVSANGESSRLLWVIQTAGMNVQNRGFQFLKNNPASGMSGNATLTRYVSFTSLVVRIACVVWCRRSELQSVHMSEEVEQATKSVMEKDGQRDPSGFLKVVHNLLWVIITEKTTVTGEEGVYSFAYTVVACLCVEKDISAGGRFCRGAVVGSRLSGILYASSCVFALYILQYRGEVPYDQARQKVIDITGSESLSALHHLTDMRSIAAGLRDEEAVKNYFQICLKHENCGYFAGEHLCAGKYGETVKLIHAAAKQKMFEKLLNGKALPERFWERAENLSDDCDARNVAYWALSDKRNENFVSESVQWAVLAAEVVHLREYGWPGWKAKALDVYLDLITALHITGGGPARGTELGSLTLRNTPGCARSVFFPCDEVMTVPHYSKTRNMKQGSLILLSRHSDRETSRLLRAFFLLIHPILVIEDARKRKAAPEDGLSEQVDPVENIRDSILLGHWDKIHIGKIIGKKMNAYGIPLSFVQYRHHQRGIVKAKKSSEYLRKIADEEEEILSQEVEFDDKNHSVRDASILQAGHSKRTADVVYAQCAKGSRQAKMVQKFSTEQYRMASYEWHIDLGLRPVNANRAEAGQVCENLDVGVPSLRNRSAGSNVATVDASAALAGLVPESSRLKELVQGKSIAEIIQCLEEGESKCAVKDTGTLRSVEGANHQGSPFGAVQVCQDNDVVMEPDIVASVQPSVAATENVTLGQGSGGTNRQKEGSSAGSKSFQTEAVAGKKVGRAVGVPSPETLQSKTNTKTVAGSPSPVPKELFACERTQARSGTRVVMEIVGSGGVARSRKRGNTLNPFFDKDQYRRRGGAIVEDQSKVRKTQSSGSRDGSESGRQGASNIRAGEPSDLLGRSRLAKQGGKSSTMENGIEAAPYGVVTGHKPYSSTAVANKLFQGSLREVEALRSVTHSKAEFKSYLQRDAMVAVAKRERDLAVILRTGEGKTAVVLGPVSQEYGVTLWVVPLRALRWETERRIESGRIQCLSTETMDGEKDADKLGAVLLVSPEEMRLESLQEYMKQLSGRGGLNRIVFDEAHLSVTARKYRSCMATLRSVKWLCGLCPVVMLTATAPPKLMNRMAEACGSSESSLQVIRGDPCRHNLSLNVSFLKNDQPAAMIAAAVDEVKTYKNKRNIKAPGEDMGRIMVICLTIKDSENVFRALRQEVGNEDVLLYNSTLSQENRRKVMQQWSSSMKHTCRIVVATEGFSTGTDSPNVRLVLFVGGSRNLVDFWQGAGRGGRDGKEAEVRVLFHWEHVRRGNAGKGDDDEISKDLVGDFVAWAEDRRSCRRSKLEVWLSGLSVAPSCEDRCRGAKKASLCDSCRTAKSEKEKGSTSWAEITDLVGAARRPTEISASTIVPSLSAVQEARKRLKEYGLIAVNEKQYLRNAGKNLRDICVGHLLRLFSVQGVRYSDEQVSNAVMKLLACKKERNGKCFTPDKRCYRCQAKNCFSKTCPVFSSVEWIPKTGKRTGGGRCRECRLSTVYSLTPHEGNEFGKRSFCNLQYCLELVMFAWSLETVRKLMRDPREGIEWGEHGVPKDTPAFGKWVTEDGDGSDAGICKAVHWIFDHMPFDLGKMSSLPEKRIVF